MTSNTSELQVTLEDLNDQETAERTSAIVYLSIVMALGIPGNLLVILVYFGTLRRRNGTHWLFIRALAITDFMVCTVAIPFELFQQTHQLTFYSEGACKFFRSLSIHLSLTSALLLILMSANRLRKVLRPLKKQLAVKQGLVLIGIMVAIAILFSWPEGVISGISIEKLDNDLIGYDCSFSDRFRKKEYTKIYSILLMTIYLACMLSLVIMYSVLGREVFKRTDISTSDQHTCPEGTSGTEMTSVRYLSDSSTEHKNQAIENKVVAMNVAKASEIVLDNITKNSKEICPKCKTAPRKTTSRKVTRVAFAISFCFILSYLPYVAVKLNASIAKGKFVKTPLTNAIFPILGRTFVINNIVNPVIYGFLDPTFVQHCKLTAKYLLCIKQ